MLKIYINNEEVVANNDFTINKHMLNTPSVILNNVCPKEWKENKDYSSFYHPQDYSKCKIQDETYIPAEPGTYTTINGTATIQNVSTSKLQEVLQLDGNTYQITTQTGKNLMPTKTFTSTSNARMVSEATSGQTVYGVPVEAGQTYTASFDITALPSSDYRIQFINSASASITQGTADPTRIERQQITCNQLQRYSVSLTTTQAGYLYLRCVPVGFTLNNIQIEKGNATSYEAYIPNSPTPDYPQPVNVVSGRQEVVVCGKNLINPNSAYTGTSNGINTTYNENQSLSFSGTTTGTWFYLTNKIDTNIPSGDYTFSIDKTVSSHTVIIRMFYNATQYQDITIAKNTTSRTASVSNDTIAYQIYCGGTTSETAINDTLFFQLEKGNTPSQYEAYTGQNYEINLGKNLNFTPYKDGTSKSTNGIQFTVNSDGSITANNTATAIAYFYCHTHDATPYLNIEKGIYYLSGGVSSNCKLNLRLYNNTTYVANFTDSGNGVVVDTRNYTYNRVFLFVQIESGTQCDNVVFKPQLEKGSQATSFASYKTPIELCKIGNYQDHIFKAKDGDSVYDNLSQETKDTLTYGSWYIEKKIGKVVLTGSDSETWNGASGNAYIVLNDTLRTNAISNYFMYSNSETTYGYMKWSASQPWLVFYGGITQHTNLAGWKTWLSTHNTSVYYIQATPTYTEITDEELLTQMNSIKLIEGLNNVSITSPYLTTPIYIHYNFVNAETIIDLLFCGVVKNSGKISLNPREPHLTTLQILDFKDFLSSGELDGFVIYQKTILEAIQMVIGNIQDYGFVLGNVNILNPNEVIGAYSTKDKTAYDVFNYLADITQSRWTTRLIDENTVAIDFYDPTLMVEGTAIDYTQSYFENNLIDNMSYNYGSNNYRNKQVMTSNQVYSNISQAQTIVANGYQTQFPTEQPIGKINSIMVDNIPMSFATFNEKDMGYVADFYYQPGDNYIESDNVLTVGQTIIIEYISIVEGRQIITNTVEIDRIEESTGRKGIISRYETRNDATTSTELQKIGESYIKYKGTPEITITIDSRKNLWEVGQRVQFNAPIEELETEYMVRTKKINYIVSADTLFYTYELVSSFNSETEINFFDNQRAKSKGNIGEGEYISRNIDIESTANIIFYDTETTEVQVDGDNELNSILNSPFIS